MHKSIRVLETEGTRVVSLINWLRPYMSKIFFRKEEMCAFASGNKLQLTSPSIYYYLFSASILVTIFSNSPKRLGGELGGRLHDPTRNGVLRGLLISTYRHSNSSLCKSSRITIVKIGAQVNANTGTIPSVNVTVFSDHFKARKKDFVIMHCIKTLSFIADIKGGIYADIEMCPTARRSPTYPT